MLVSLRLDTCALQEALDAEVASLLQEIAALPDDPADAPPPAPDSPLQAAGQAEPLAPEPDLAPEPVLAEPRAAGPWEDPEPMRVGPAEARCMEEEVEEEEEEDEAEEEEDEWEPGVATPWRGRRVLRRTGTRSLSGGSVRPWHGPPCDLEDHIPSVATAQGVS